MFKRPEAYICSPFRGNTEENAARAAKYCRQIYEAGYNPVAPHLFYPQFMDDRIPEERKDALEMGLQKLRHCHVLVVCGDKISEGMMAEIIFAHRHHITATTLEGIMSVKQQTETPQAGENHC